MLARFRPSPAMVVACTALIVALAGSAYAVTSLPKNSVGTKQLKKNAVTTKKIKDRAVNGAKINVSSLGTVPNASKLGGRRAAAYALTHGRGVALAGAKVASNGSVETWFNTLGGKPTVDDGGGSYYITFPGVTHTDRDVIQATLPENAGEIIGGATSDGKQVAVQAYDSAGSVQSYEFYVVVYGASPSG